MLFKTLSARAFARSRKSGSILAVLLMLLVSSFQPLFSFSGLVAQAAAPGPKLGSIWINTGSLNTGRYAHTATLLPNGKVLVAGGRINGNYLDSAELYDPTTGTWSSTSSMTTSRSGHTATLLPSGKVLVAGGYHVGSELTASELYDPATGTWSSTGNLNTPRSRHTATLLANGNVLVAGGDTNGNTVDTAISSAELYDPATGSWTNTGGLSTARDTHTATLLPNGKVLVAGGWHVYYGYGIINATELYDPATGTWSNTGSLNTARAFHTATLLPNGKVLVAGGNNSSTILASAELYDPTAGTWSNTGSFNTARTEHTATLLPNGKVLAAGGGGSTADLASAELYDITTGVWANTASMNNIRFVHTATLLPNGKVLVAGGVGNTGGNLASAELYDPGTGSPSLTYNLPLLANNADTPVGHITTFITFQNLSTNTAATVNVQYYAIANGSAGLTENPITIPPKGQHAIASNIPSGSSYGGIVTSNVPLNLVVSEALNAGGSAYNVAASTASTLYSPLALNGQYGFTTSMIVFNAAATGTATGQIQFFDEMGNPAGTTQNLNIPAHASQTFNQAANGSGLANNHAYWAKIVGAAGSQLTAQVIEFGPANFVATFNALVPSQVQSTVYAPATFNGNYNFVTGMAIANPNGTAANLTISYYNAAGTQRLQTSKIIPANGNIGVFQPNETGLPTDVTSAVISSNQPLISTVNERGPGTISGTYVGLTSGSTTVALPVMAKGYASFITGATILNTSSQPATLTFTYYDQSGTQIGTPQTPPPLAPNASFLAYQGDAAQGLPGGFFGTAIITSNQPLLVTTNALQTGTGLFYTYTEPNNMINPV